MWFHSGAAATAASPALARVPLGRLRTIEEEPAGDGVALVGLALFEARVHALRRTAAPGKALRTLLNAYPDLPEADRPGGIKQLFRAQAFIAEPYRRGLFDQTVMYVRALPPTERGILWARAADGLSRFPQAERRGVFMTVADGLDGLSSMFQPLAARSLARQIRQLHSTEEQVEAVGRIIDAPWGARSGALSTIIQEIPALRLNAQQPVLTWLIETLPHLSTATAVPLVPQLSHAVSRSTGVNDPRELFDRLDRHAGARKHTDPLQLRLAQTYRDFRRSEIDVAVHATAGAHARS